MMRFLAGLEVSVTNFSVADWSAGEPKFPTPTNLDFLLNLSALSDQLQQEALSGDCIPGESVCTALAAFGIPIEKGWSEEVALHVQKIGKKCREMVDKTLLAMWMGGIHDHVGKGFHRYSVDRHWHVPQ